MTTQQTIDLAIVGGGASGLMAALSAVESARPPLRVLVLEKQNRVGRKLAATGNGRCNLTNAHAAAAHYHTSGSSDFVESVLSAVPVSAVLDSFRKIGVFPVEKEDGRIYPLSDQAASVTDALRFALEEKGVQTRCEAEVRSISRQAGGFRLQFTDGSTLFARRVILAAGGQAAPKLGGGAGGYRLAQSLGHTLLPCFPALTALKTETESLRALKGCKYQGEIALLIDGQVARREQGEILFTEYGLSGIAVMQLSGLAAQAAKQQVFAEMRLLPFSLEETRQFLFERQRALSQRPLEEFLTGVVNKRVGQTLLRRCTEKPLTALSETLTRKEIYSLASLLHGWRLRVTGVQGYDQAQVTGGGVPLREVDAKTMQSRRCPGLYLCGELLDVDGDCGGYNLQWAWATGFLAGRAAATTKD